MTLLELFAAWPNRAAFVADLAERTGAGRNAVRNWFHRRPPARFAAKIAEAAAERGHAWTTDQVLEAINSAKREDIQNVTA